MKGSWIPDRVGNDKWGQKGRRCIVLKQTLHAITPNSLELEMDSLFREDDILTTGNSLTERGQTPPLLKTPLQPKKQRTEKGRGWRGWPQSGRVR